MNFNFPFKTFKSSDLIKKCGYGEWFDKQYNKTSYTRKLGSGNYPRFHIYLTDYENYFEVSLHLDQKQASYIKGKAHSGEYDGEVVENEARRITAVIADIYGV